MGEALQYLREYDKEASEVCFRVSSSQWNYATNMTDFNKRRMIEEQTHKAKFDKLSWIKAVNFDWLDLHDPMARRQLKLIITNSRASLSDDKYNEVCRILFIYHVCMSCLYLVQNNRYIPARALKMSDNRTKR